MNAVRSMEARREESDGSALTGRRFGPYEVGEVIGTGGMGEVYRARDTRLNRDVAIKVLPASLRVDGERVAGLDQEARMLAALNHPNIATIHGITLATPTLAPDGRLLVFSACTVCDTEDLTNWLPHRRPLDQFQALPIADAKGAFFFFFSPDAQSLGFGTREGLKKLSLAGGTPVTLYEGLVNGADWGQDGTIVFASESGLMRMPAAGGKPQSLTRAKPGTYHVSPAILPGNAGVLFTEWHGNPATGTGQLAVASLDADSQRVLIKGSSPRMGDNPAFDIGMLPASGGESWEPLLHSDAAEVDPDISPDGTWIAYSSNRTGRFEIYVERFPDLGERQIVSIDGGVEPLWAPSGKEIFYRSIDGRRMLAVPFDSQSGVQGRTAMLFEGSYASYLSGLPFRSYDLTPDATRFVMVKDLPVTTRAGAATEINIVLNWSQEVSRRVPAK